MRRSSEKDADSLNWSERVGDSQVSWVRLATTNSVWNTADLVSRYVDSGRVFRATANVAYGILERATRLELATFSLGS